MPITPERLTTRQEVRGAISSHFWEQPVQSSHFLDGLAYNLPAEPLPVVPAPSGLSRTQQLLALQALSLPFTPAFDGSAGGTVLDRVLAKAGGFKWWTALSGRAKAQKMLRAHRDGKHVGDTLKDLNNYCLCSRLRLTVGRNLSLNTLVESTNLQTVAEAVRQHQQHNPGHRIPPIASLPLRSRFLVQQQLPGHQLRATVARNESYVDSAASECFVPLSMSLDLASTERPDGIQYRAGLHQVSAPEEESSGSQNMLPSPRDRTADGHTLRSSLHFQGAVAVEGEAHLWRPRQKDPEEPSWAEQHPAFSSRQGEVTPLQTDSRADLGLQASSSSATGPSPVHKMVPAQQPDAKAVSGPKLPQEAAQAPAVAAVPGEADGAADLAQSLAALEGSSTGDNSRDAQASSPQQATEEQIPYDWMVSIDAHGNALVIPGPSSQSAGEKGPVAVIPSSMPALQELPEVEPSTSAGASTGTARPTEAGSILAGMDGARRSIRELQGSINALTAQMHGSFMRPRYHGRMRRQRQRHRPPYSAWVAQPFLKVNAAIGCMARMPLPTPLPAAPHRSRSEPHLAHAASSGNLESASSWRARFGNDVWGPYIRETALRVFASGALSAQVGRFRRPILDFTAASVRLDLGLTSLHETGAVAGSIGEANAASRDSSSGNSLASNTLKHRAFALEARGVWHAVTASASQQILGPLRAHASARLALEHPTPAARNDRGRITSGAIAASIRSLRPSLLEAQWGLDYVIPKTGGALRAYAWWSPLRRQGMIEARLF